MNNYLIRKINHNEYSEVRKLDRDAFEYNERGSDADFHEVFADNIRFSPYFIPELDLVAVSNDGIILGHAIFSALPMGDCGEHIIWLNSLSVRHGETDSHIDKSYEYQRKGIGTAIVKHGFMIAKALGYTGCMTCGHPAVYKNKMRFLDCNELGISMDDSVDDPEGCVFAIELVPGGFEKTNKLLSYLYYDFTKIEQNNIKFEKLIFVLSKMFNESIIRSDCKTEQLQGGTVGNVKLLTGISEADGGKKYPYKLILKIQKKWDRFGDCESWRREYDFYASEFNSIFTDSFRWPKCYHAEINDCETQIWMEYIDGTSGNDLSIEILESAAFKLGRFQAMLYTQKPSFMQNIANLSKTDFLKNDYKQWNSQTEEYRYLRSDKCVVPEHLRQMIIDMDDGAEKIFKEIEKLPVVLCHRDFWLENIIYADGKCIIIDWDTAGWGFMGEDIASLIADDTDVEYMDEYFRRFIPAYYKGVSEYMDISLISDNCIRNMILIKFGYRFIHKFMFASSPDDKIQQVNKLQKIYDMKKI